MPAPLPPATEHAMTTVVFYREQADRERSEADASPLDHVRERHLRAAAAWTVLGDRLDRANSLRAARENDRIVAEALGVDLDRHLPVA